MQKMIALRGLPLVSMAFLLALLLPYVVSANVPFGGMTGIVRGCHNNAIFASVGPPKGGQLIWKLHTKTYQFGPPRRGGQWLLGLKGPPDLCVVRRFPLEVWPGDLIIMMGSSQ